MPSLELQLLKDSEGAASVRDVLPSEIQAGPSGTVARTQAHVVCANSLMTTLQRMKCGIACLLLATSARAQTALRPFADADAVRLNAPRSASLLRDLDSSLEQVVAKVSPAVVQIVVTGYGPLEDHGHSDTARIVRQHAIGAGVIVDSDGYIITTLTWCKERSASESSCRRPRQTHRSTSNPSMPGRSWMPSCWVRTNNPIWRFSR